ncbi:MAG: tryptophan 7-halogenase [Gammaproteobacteria bacterium]|nr:tryptophan 7-halogenase [Gammaproteobacteria bacterium]MBU1776756.1 tryptophan 7-halogenase [Gammaproteobacteria bacterium]MBU1967938.1 tryptophan 7-halogenase [Gammaproteobacteria bacterium]
MAEQETSCEVLVIGGGPAGSTIAALLAQRGRDVLMLEKSKHPRFHIGESLLPMNMPMFEELGLLDEIKRIGIVKLGAEFVSPWHPAPVMIDFNDSLDNTWPSAYQVRRDEFDEVMFKNAAAKGARVVEECKVTDVKFLPKEGALVDTLDKDGKTQRIRTKFVVDASGRDTFLSNHFQMKHRNKKHNSAAMFGHFSGVKRLEGEVEGNISLFWFDHGWFWFIPLPDGNTSIGATCWPYYMKTRGKTDLTQFFMDTIAMCPALMERMKDAKLETPVTATGNFSYLSERSSGENYILLGDAFAFIDPIFSSGVFLAMASSFAGATAVERCLSKPQEAEQALKEFDKAIMQGPKVFSWFIYRITTPAMRNLLMYKGAESKVKKALISILIGDVYRTERYSFWLLMFKLMYYTGSVLHLPSTIKAWFKRKRSIQVLDVAVTETYGQ